MYDQQKLDEQLEEQANESSDFEETKPEELPGFGNTPEDE